jgi:AcrR family transcriptional regulator
MNTVPTQLVSRQARADDTRVRLFTAGAELFATQGYHATSVEQIARRAGVAKGTFFLHFPTKDAIVMDLVRLQVRVATSERERLVAKGAAPTARLRALVLALGRMSDRNVSRAVLTAALQGGDVGSAIDHLFEGVLDLMTDDAKAAVRARELSRTTDPAMFALLLMDAFLGATLSFATNPRGRSLMDMLVALVDMNLAVFAPKKITPKKVALKKITRGRVES